MAHLPLKRKKSQFSRESPPISSEEELSEKDVVLEEEDDTEESEVDKDDPEREFDVDYIMDDQPNENVFYRFKVHWLGYDSSEDSWVNDADMTCPDKLASYWKLHQKRHIIYQKRKKKLEERLGAERRRVLAEEKKKRERERKKEDEKNMSNFFVSSSEEEKTTFSDEEKKTKFRKGKGLGMRPNPQQERRDAALAKVTEDRIRKEKNRKKTGEKRGRSLTFSDSQSSESRQKNVKFRGRILPSESEEDSQSSEVPPKRKKVGKRLSTLSTPEPSPEPLAKPSPEPSPEPLAGPLAEPSPELDVTVTPIAQKKTKSTDRRQLEREIFGSDVSDISICAEAAEDAPFSQEVVKKSSQTAASSSWLSDSDSADDVTMKKVTSHPKMTSLSIVGSEEVSSSTPDEQKTRSVVGSSGRLSATLKLREASLPPVKRLVRAYVPEPNERVLSPGSSPDPEPSPATVAPPVVSKSAVTAAPPVAVKATATVAPPVVSKAPLVASKTPASAAPPVVSKPALLTKVILTAPERVASSPAIVVPTKPQPVPVPVAAVSVPKVIPPPISHPPPAPPPPFVQTVAVPVSRISSAVVVPTPVSVSVHSVAVRALGPVDTKTVPQMSEASGLKTVTRTESTGMVAPPSVAVSAGEKRPPPLVIPSSIQSGSLLSDVRRPTGLLTCRVERAADAVDPRLKGVQGQMQADLLRRQTAEKPSNLGKSQVSDSDRVQVSKSGSAQTEPVPSTVPYRPVLDRIIGCIRSKNGYRGYLVKFTDRPNASHVSEAYMEEHYLDDVVNYCLRVLKPPADF